MGRIGTTFGLTPQKRLWELLSVGNLGALGREHFVMQLVSPNWLAVDGGAPRIRSANHLWSNRITQRSDNMYAVRQSYAGTNSSSW